MEKPLITSLSNPLVKEARSLRQKKARQESELFLVEGIHHVGEALEAHWDVDYVLYAPELLTSNFARELVERLHTKRGGSLTKQTEPHAVSAQVMESLADKENPQGILAVVHQKETTFSSLQSLKTSVALVSPQDPGNVGTILRTMDAVGVDALFLLDGGVDVYHPTAVRSSMGTLFWKPIVHATFDEFTFWARAKKVQIIGTSAHADVDYRTLVHQAPWVLMLGNEQKGLSQAQTKVCDVTVSLPMKGRVSSLNLSVAAGVLLYSLNG
jgi:TrmH family RNA methyltransferase